jgi:hypothetical protein
VKFIDEGNFFDSQALGTQFLHSHNNEQIGVVQVKTHVGKEIQVAENGGILSGPVFQQVNCAILNFDLAKLSVQI